jgi:hypothetical protein
MVVSSFSCSGISTGDLNPIYNVPMLGTHKGLQATRHPAEFKMIFRIEFAERAIEVALTVTRG